MAIQATELGMMHYETLLGEIGRKGSEYLWIDIRNELRNRLIREHNCNKVNPPQHGKWGFGAHETAVGLHVAMCRNMGMDDRDIAYELACTYTYEQLAELLPHMNAARP